MSYNLFLWSDVKLYVMMCVFMCSLNAPLFIDERPNEHKKSVITAAFTTYALFTWKVKGCFTRILLKESVKRECKLHCKYITLFTCKRTSEFSSFLTKRFSISSLIFSPFLSNNRTYIHVQHKVHEKS